MYFQLLSEKVVITDSERCCAPLDPASSLSGAAGSTRGKRNLCFSYAHSHL